MKLLVQRAVKGDQWVGLPSNVGCQPAGDEMTGFLLFRVI